MIEDNSKAEDNDNFVIPTKKKVSSNQNSQEIDEEDDYKMTNKKV